MTKQTDTLEALAARVEAATADQQRELLVEAFYLIHGELGPGAPAHRFFRAIEAEAYESAALTLVPEGYGIYTRWSLKGGETRTADAILTREVSQALGERAYWTSENAIVEVIGCKTLPLAICAASLKARAKVKE